MKEPSVSVRNLTKSFSGRAVVDNLSFDVRKGQVFALLGHNGAGKSTNIALILGLKAPDGGSAKILGMDAAKNRETVFERVGVQLQNTQYLILKRLTTLLLAMILCLSLEACSIKAENVSNSQEIHTQATAPKGTEERCEDIMQDREKH